LNRFPDLTRSLVGSHERHVAAAACRRELKRWQANRLAETYADHAGKLRACIPRELAARGARAPDRARRSSGHRLDALVHKPLVSRTLKLMRHPARLAGLSELQNFLERGFDAFRRMHGAQEFLATIRRRETTIVNELFSVPARRTAR
jgi:hypothetical protein